MVKTVLLTENELTRFMMNQSDGALCERRLKKLEIEKQVTDVLVKKLKTVIQKNKNTKCEEYFNAMNNLPNEGTESFPERLRSKVSRMMSQTGRPSNHFSKTTGLIKTNKKHLKRGVHF